MKKILSCIPKQEKDYDAKLKWLEKTMRENEVDIIVTPQEFIGGAYIMEHRKSFTEKEIIDDIANLCQKYSTAIILGVEEKLKNINKESVWFITKEGKLKDKVYKFALPGYDHINTNGYGEIVPELHLEDRIKFIGLEGIRFSVVFCWEVFSDILWAGLGIERPDVVLNMIKFGVNAWPKLDKKGEKTKIKEFGYGTWEKQGEQNIWIERLKFASKFQVLSPIICSTNSWNLRPISLPLVGCISKIPGQVKKESFWRPKKNMKLKKIPEKIIIDVIDPAKIRTARQTKWKYKDATGGWPPYDLGELTMLLKMRRIEQRLKTGKEKKRLIKKLCSK